MIAEPVIVGGLEISEAVIAAEAQHHPAPNPESARAAAAQALAVRQLLLGEAERQGIAAGEARDEQGRTLAEEDARIEALLAAVIHTPNADEVTCLRYYQNHRDRFVSPPLVEAAHILIKADPADAFAMGLATGDARTLIRKLLVEPERFAEFARTHSACPSCEQGGNLGQVGPGQMVQAINDALFALPQQTLCPDPIKTRFGVHVIRTGRRVEARQLPFEAVRKKIASYLEEASYRSAVAQYIGILVDRLGVSGVAFGDADGSMMQ